MAVKPGYQQTEVGVIPVEWSLATLGNHVELLSGQHVLAADYNEHEIGMPYLTGPADFVGETPTVSKWTASPRTIAANGDILLTVKGSGAGSSFILTLPSAAISRQLMSIRSKSINSGYLRYFIANKRNELASQAVGNLIPGLSRADVLNLRIPIPPLSEQQAIAEALSDVDGLISALDALIAKKRAIKQGAMQELLTGQRRLPGFAGEWAVKKIADIAPLQRGFDLPTPELRSGAFPVVYSNGILTHHAEYKAKGPGVVTGRSGTIGKVTFVDQNYWPHNTSLWVTDFKGNDPKFIYYLYIYINFERFGTGSGVPTLNRNDVHVYQIHVPPPAEQTAIAQLLADMDGELAALAAKRAKTVAVKAGMMQTLLTGQVRLV